MENSDELCKFRWDNPHQVLCFHTACMPWEPVLVNSLSSPGAIKWTNSINQFYWNESKCWTRQSPFAISSVYKLRRNVTGQGKCVFRGWELRGKQGRGHPVSTWEAVVGWGEASGTSWCDVTVGLWYGCFAEEWGQAGGGWPQKGGTIPGQVIGKEWI